MARLGEYIVEQSNPLGTPDAQGLQLIGVSNEHGLQPSTKKTAASLARYVKIERNWFAYNPMRVNVGSIGLADDDSKTGFTSPDYVVFSCLEGLEPAYLLLFLKSKYGLEEIGRHCSGAVRKRLYYSGLAEIEIPIPDPETQREFVKRAHQITNTISQIRDENSDKHEMPLLKQAILQEAIQGDLTADWRAAHADDPDVEPAAALLERIRAEKARLIAAKKIRKEKPLPELTEDEIPFNIPEGWVWCRLSEIAIHSLGKMLDKGKNVGKLRPYLRNLNIQWYEVRVEDVKEMRIEDSEIEKYSVTRGDVLICEGGYPGQAAIWDRSDEIYFQKALHRVRFVLEGFNSSLFVHLLRLSDQTRFIENYFTGSGIKHFTGKSLAKFPIPLPPLAEQAVIVERVEALMETCRALEAEIEHARTHAENLLQAVLKEAFAPATDTAT